MMKSLFGLAIVLLMASCNSDTPAETTVATDTTATEVKEEVKFLYPATFSADWKIGDPQKIVKVQELYKVMLADSNYESTIPYYADSITNLSFDNRVLRLSAPAFVDAVKNFRKGFKSLDEEFRSYVVLKNEEKNTEMVLVWVKEKGVRQSGKVDSSSYQETWRFNNQGKIDYRSIFVRYDF